MLGRPTTLREPVSKFILEDSASTPRGLEPLFRRPLRGTADAMPSQSRCLKPVLVLMILLSGLTSASTGEPSTPRPRGFSAQAIALPAHSIGKTVIRARPALAVDIRVDVEDYTPRGMEPTLIIGGTPVPAASGLVAVEGRVSKLSFVVQKPEFLKDGAKLELQTGEDPRSRVAVPGELKLDSIRPLDPEQSKRFALPSVSEWLKQAEQKK